MPAYSALVYKNTYQMFPANETENAIKEFKKQIDWKDGGVFVPATDPWICNVDGDYSSSKDACTEFEEKMTCEIQSEKWMNSTLI